MIWADRNIEHKSWAILVGNNNKKMYLPHWRGRSASHDDGCLTANVTARVNVTDVPARNALKMTAAPTLRAISNAPCPGSRATSKVGVD